MRTLTNRMIVSVFAVMVLSIAANADKVYLAPATRTAADSTWYPRSLSVVQGDVRQLDDKVLEISIQGQNGSEKMAAYRVVWVEPGQRGDEQTKAIKLFADGNYSAAVRPLIDSLGERPPVWQQQWLSMLAANAAWRSSRYEIAMELVSQLDQRPMPACTLAWLPIAWQPARAKVGMVSAAEKRLSDPSVAVRLVAASWLLQSPSRKSAISNLERIAADNERPTLARLAHCCLWSVATPPQVKESHRAWEDKLTQLPLALQTGPRLTLAEKCDAAGLETVAMKHRLALELVPAGPYQPK